MALLPGSVKNLNDDDKVLFMLPQKATSNKKRVKMALYHSSNYRTSSESNGISLQEEKYNTDF